MRLLAHLLRGHLECGEQAGEKVTPTWGAKEKVASAFGGTRILFASDGSVVELVGAGQAAAAGIGSSAEGDRSAPFKRDALCTAPIKMPSIKASEVFSVERGEIGCLRAVDVGATAAVVAAVTRQGAVTVAGLSLEAASGIAGDESANKSDNPVGPISVAWMWRSRCSGAAQAAAVSVDIDPTSLQGAERSGENVRVVATHGSARTVTFVRGGRRGRVCGVAGRPTQVVFAVQEVQEAARGEKPSSHGRKEEQEASPGVATAPPGKRRRAEAAGSPAARCFAVVSGPPNVPVFEEAAKAPNGLVASLTHSSQPEHRTACVAAADGFVMIGGQDGAVSVFSTNNWRQIGGVNIAVKHSLCGLQIDPSDPHTLFGLGTDNEVQPAVWADHASTARKRGRGGGVPIQLDDAQLAKAKAKAERAKSQRTTAAALPKLGADASARERELEQHDAAVAAAKVGTLSRLHLNQHAGFRGAAGWVGLAVVPYARAWLSAPRAAGGQQVPAAALGAAAAACDADLAAVDASMRLLGSDEDAAMEAMMGMEDEEEEDEAASAAAGAAAGGALCGRKDLSRLGRPGYKLADTDLAMIGVTTDGEVYVVRRARLLLPPQWRKAL